MSQVRLGSGAITNSPQSPSYHVGADRKLAINFIMLHVVCGSADWTSEQLSDAVRWEQSTCPVADADHHPDPDLCTF